MPEMRVSLMKRVRASGITGRPGRIGSYFALKYLARVPIRATVETQNELIGSGEQVMTNIDSACYVVRTLRYSDFTDHICASATRNGPRTERGDQALRFPCIVMQR